MCCQPVFIVIYQIRRNCGNYLQVLCRFGVYQHGTYCRFRQKRWVFTALADDYEKVFQKVLTTNGNCDTMSAIGCNEYDFAEIIFVWSFSAKNFFIVALVWFQRALCRRNYVRMKFVSQKQTSHSYCVRVFVWSFSTKNFSIVALVWLQRALCRRNYLRLCCVHTRNIIKIKEKKHGRDNDIYHRKRAEYDAFNGQPCF